MHARWFYIPFSSQVFSAKLNWFVTEFPRSESQRGPVRFDHEGFGERMVHVTKRKTKHRTTAKAGEVAANALADQMALQRVFGTNLVACFDKVCPQYRAKELKETEYDEGAETGAQLLKRRLSGRSADVLMTRAKDAFLDALRDQRCPGWTEDMLDDANTVFSVFRQAFIPGVGTLTSSQEKSSSEHRRSSWFLGSTTPMGATDHADTYCFEAEMWVKVTAQAAPPIRYSVCIRRATVPGTQTADGSFRAVQAKPTLVRGTGQVRDYIVFVEHIYAAVVTWEDRDRDRVLITACTSRSGT